MIITLHAHAVTGIFNVSNKLFVAMDILLEMQFHISMGEPVHNCCKAVFKSLSLSGGQDYFKPSADELKYLEEKLYDGYFAFEAATRRDWDDAICGICGTAPVFESGDGNCKNCVPIKRGQVYNYSYQHNCTCFINDYYMYPWSQLNLAS